MTVPSCRVLPDVPLDEHLRARIVEVTARIPSPLSSSHPSETITCRIDDGTLLLMHVKRCARDRPDSHGHRGGLRRELDAYLHVLQPQRDGTPALLGWSEEACTLVLEHVVDALPVHHVEHGLSQAARWLGRFHEAARGTAILPALRDSYYSSWLRRTLAHEQRAGTRPAVVRRLQRLVRDPAAYLGPLVESERVVVHGEFFPANVLFAGGSVCPVDWESASLGPGELDVASLVDDWPPDVAVEVAQEYMAGRWPGEPEMRAASSRRMRAAAVYWSLRWLGDGRPWTDATRQQALDVLEARLEEVQA